MLLLISLAYYGIRLCFASLPADYCDHYRKPTQPLSTFLWTLRRPMGFAPVYFFGTIHVPYAEVQPHLSNEVMRAFRNSNNIILELDLTNPSTMRDLAKCKMLPKGEHISQHIPKETFRRLKQELGFMEKRLPVWFSNDRVKRHSKQQRARDMFHQLTDNWQRKRPVWVLLMLNSLLELEPEAERTPILDVFLADAAAKDAKQVGAIESPREQCDPLNSLESSQILFAINQTLRRFTRSSGPNGANPSKDLTRHYICGSLDAGIFNRDSKGSNQYIDALFRQKLIVERNVRMAQRVIQIVTTRPADSLFFAFGLGHFLGESSVIEHLKQAGFDVAPVLHQKEQSAKESWTRLKEKKQLGWLDVPSFLRQEPRSLKFQRTTARPPQFQDLWVRVENFTSSWQEIEFGRHKVRSREARRLPHSAFENSARSSAHLSWILLPTLFQTLNLI